MNTRKTPIRRVVENLVHEGFPQGGKYPQGEQVPMVKQENEVLLVPLVP